MLGLPGVRAHRFGSEPVHVAFLDEPGHDLGVGAGRMRAVGLHVQVVGGLGALGPVGAHQHPGPRGDAAVLFFPFLDEVDGQEEVRVAGGLGGTIDHAGAGDEGVDGNRVHRVVRLVLARDPVRGRIEVRAGVFRAREVVPVPGRTALVVARDFLDPERPGLPEFRRQHDGGKLRRQRFGQVHQADAPGDQLGHELGKDRLTHDALSCWFLRVSDTLCFVGVRHPLLLRRCLTPFETPCQVAGRLPRVSDTGFFCRLSDTGFFCCVGV